MILQVWGSIFVDGDFARRIQTSPENSDWIDGLFIPSSGHRISSGCPYLSERRHLDPRGKDVFNHAETCGMNPI